MRLTTEQELELITKYLICPAGHPEMTLTYSDYVARKALLQSRLKYQQDIENDLSAPTQLSTFQYKCMQWYRAFPNVVNAARMYYSAKGLTPREVDAKTYSTSLEVFENAKKRGLKVPHFTNFQNV